MHVTRNKYPAGFFAGTNPHGSALDNPEGFPSENGRISSHQKNPPKLFPAQQFNFAGKAVHPFPCFLREVNGRSDTLFNGCPVATGYQVVCMRNYLLFRCFRNTVPGREAKKRTFIGRKTGTGMAFHDPGQFFRTP